MVGATTAVAALLLAIVASACYPPVPAGDDFATRWANLMSGPTNADEIDGVATAPDSSVYVTGKFEQSDTLGGTTLTSAGAADIPVARFDAYGRTIWVQRFGGPGEDNLFDVDADAAGMVGTGWFAGTVDFGGVTLTSSGPSDCVVLALRPDGSTRWARRFGGPGADGCNEVTLSGGTITTSIDTQGGWTPTGQAPLAPVTASDTVLVRLDADGTPRWMRPVTGTGAQRGKSLAVAPDGSVSFGGDTVGPPTVAGTVVAAPPGGGGRDAWLSRWSPTGTLEWATTWGGPGDDLAKGVTDDGQRITVVGAFTGTITQGTTTLDAGAANDLLVAQRAPDGTVRWATAVSAPTAVGGAEVVTAPDGGVLFGAANADGIRFGSAAGGSIPLDTSDGGTGWLAHYRPDGTPAFARTIPGTVLGFPGEIARNGNRVYLDVAIFGNAATVNGTPIPAVGKDASVWAIDLAAA